MWSEITCTDFDETTTVPSVGRAINKTSSARHGRSHRKKLGYHAHAHAPKKTTTVPSTVGVVGGGGGGWAGPDNRRGVNHLGEYLHEVLNASRHKAATHTPVPATVRGSSERQIKTPDVNKSRRALDVVELRNGGGDGGGGIEKSTSAGILPEAAAGGGGGNSRRHTLQRSGRHGKGHLREALGSILARANSEGSSTLTLGVPPDEGLVQAFSSLLASSSSSSSGEKERGGESGEDRRRRYRVDSLHQQGRRKLQPEQHHPISYSKVFTGHDAVDAILAGGHAASYTREEALRVARRLERKWDPYEHVMGAHVFRDDHSLYRFRNRGGQGGGREAAKVPSETNNKRSDADATDETTGTSSPSLHSSDRRRRRRPTCARAFATIHGEVSLVSHLIATTTEEEVIRTVRTVEVRDRRHNLRTYEDCFVGRELISLLVSSGCCKTREEAVLVGHVVGEKYDLFEHVGGGKHHHDLEDSNLLYRFKETSPSSLEWSPTEAVVAPPNVRKAARRLSNVGMCSCRQLQARDVSLVWTAIFRQVDVRDRVWHWRTYKKCFVGSEVVDLLVMKALCTSRADGVRVIRVINAHLDLFEHVLGHHQFEDDYLFYRFKR